MLNDYLQVLISLLVIIPLIFGSVYLLKRFGTTVKNTARMRLVERLNLSSKHQLVIVEVDQKPMLLGVSAEKITHLPYELNSQLPPEKRS